VGLGLFLPMAWVSHALFVVGGVVDAFGHLMPVESLLHVLGSRASSTSVKNDGTMESVVIEERYWYEQQYA